jgi:hypothetical protein
MSEKTFYLAGPMSGLPQFNFPLFREVARDLRMRGFKVISPAELDEAESVAAAMASKNGDPIAAHRSWGHYLSRDIKIVADQVQGIIFLPGWEKSRGARLEAMCAALCNHEFLEYRDGDLTPIDKHDVLAIIAEQIK